MRTSWIRLVVVGCVLSLGGAALAQSTVDDKKKAARQLYDEGSAKYDFGRYQDAIELFTRSYETYPSPVLLFNIAQAHRQLGDCKNAIHFYTRYLEKKPDAANRAEVEGFLKDLKVSCTAAATGTGTTGTGTGTTGTGTTGTGTTGTGTGTTGTGTGTGTAGTRPSGTGTTGTTTTGTTGVTGTRPIGTTTTGATGTRPTGTTTTGATGTRPTGTTTTGATGTRPIGTTTGTSTAPTGSGTRSAALGISDDDDSDVDTLTVTSEAEPSLIAGRLALGPSFPSFGDLDPAPAFSLALGAAYPILSVTSELAVDAGALLTYTPVPWQGADGGSGTAGLTGLLANAGASLSIMPGLSGRAELGLGLLVMSGLGRPGNPFLEPGEMASGPLSFVHTRLALGAEYALSSSLVITAQPLVLSWSPAGALRDEVGSITRFEMLAGVGYKL